MSNKTCHPNVKSVNHSKNIYCVVSSEDDGDSVLGVNGVFRLFRVKADAAAYMRECVLNGFVRSRLSVRKAKVVVA